MEGRLATSVLVGGLIRKAEAEGGFGAVLAKGDATAGALLVVLTERGANPTVLERVLQPDGVYAWREAAVNGEAGSAAIAEFIARNRRFDPDLWVLELDIPSGERFAAAMKDLD